MIADILKQSPVLRRIRHIHAAAQHRDHRPARRQCAGQTHRIHTVGSAGRHNRAQPSHLIAKHFALLQAVERGVPRADHGDDRLRINVRERPLIVEQQRRIVNAAQPRRIGRVLPGEDVDALAVTFREDAARLREILVLERFRVFQALDAAICLRVRVEDRLRRSEPPQRRVHSLPSQSTPGCQPQPVFQHRSSVPFLVGSFASPLPKAANLPVYFYLLPVI